MSTSPKQRVVASAPDLEVEPWKSRSSSCRYCRKRFNKQEHLRRHERAHVKEKAFHCPCGKVFARRDLLREHEKTVHRDGFGGGNDIPFALSQNDDMVVQETSTASFQAHDTGWMKRGEPVSRNPNVESLGDILMIHSSSRAVQQEAKNTSLDLLSDAVNQLTSSHSSSLSLQNDSRSSLVHSSSYGGDKIGSHSLHEIGQPEHLDDYSLFWDDFGNGFNIFMPGLVPYSSIPNTLMSSSGLNQVEHRESDQTDGNARRNRNSFSRFGSRLPSLQPESPNDPQELITDVVEKSRPPWYISSNDYQKIKHAMEEFLSVLPERFCLPARHTLSRYLEGYVNGFHEHMPFLHTATMQPVNYAPELILAIAAIGAQYRFEGYNGNHLWFASRKIALKQIHRRTTETSELSKDENRRRLETIQALLLLMAMGTWGPRVLLQEALCLQSKLALLVQEAGLSSRGISSTDLSWTDWIEFEGKKRTLFIVYCLFNLHCIAYNIPPLILSSGLRLSLPHSAKEWKAETSSKWESIRRKSPPIERKFQDEIAALFSDNERLKATTPMPSLGNYVLINSIVQQVYFWRQARIWSIPDPTAPQPICEDTEKLGRALRRWQENWERSPESSLDPSNTDGPVAFNSTALLRLAYIRLHVDLGPCRHLDTRDPFQIANSLRGFSSHIRGAHVSRAVLQSAHALSIPIRIGIAFVARTQTFSWSIQHSLCNLECAFLLSKWLESIATSPNSKLSGDESTLLDMVRNMLGETEFAVSFATSKPDEELSLNKSSKIRQLSVAVVRAWAAIFSGEHIFEVVKVICSSLEIYADLLDRENRSLQC